MQLVLHDTSSVGKIFLSQSYLKGNSGRLRSAARGTLTEK